MRLHKLQLTNWKGQRDLTLIFNGRDAKIRADNAVGKTTLLDSFVWLLTGKDHLGRADYQIKTLDAAGNAIPMLDHVVEAILEINGIKMTLKRTYREVWTKKAGSTDKTFTGHETEYHINNVPKAQKDYNAFIDSIVPPQLLKLLIMPGYFCEQIKSEDRRRMLLDLGGDIDELAMLQADPKYAALVPHISKFVSVSEFKAAQAKQKTKINSDLQGIPVAINVHTQYLNAGGLKEVIEQQGVDILSKQIERLEAERTALMNGEGIEKLRRELAELRTAKANAAAEVANRTAELKAPIRKKLEAAEDQRADICGDLAKTFRTRDSLDGLIKRLKDEKKSLLTEYKKIQEQEFTGDTVCPVCGQDIPEDRIEETRAAFNEDKSNKLGENVKAGKNLAADIAAKEQEMAETIVRIDQLRTDDKKAGDAIKALEHELEEIQINVFFDDDLISTKQTEIDGFDDSVSGRKGDINLEISRLAAKKDEHEQNLAAIRQAEKAKKDIADLKVKEKDLSSQFEACERLVALCDDFTNTKVQLLDAKISGAFRMVTWKLTETQVNGGLKEICDALIDGVPYMAANNAAQINSGLDIIETFSRVYGVALPVFIDNAESVTQLNPMSNSLDPPQIIQLIVSEAHKKLDLEVL
jgi:RNA polymerase-binding transcription factor DksA